jgi:hypothetical protein
MISPVLSATAASRVLAGRSVVLRGTIGPQRRVLALSLARESRGRLVTVARRTVLASRGAFRSAVRLSLPGLYRLHVRYAGDLGTRPASSDVFVRAVRHASSLKQRTKTVSGGAAGPQG